MQSLFPITSSAGNTSSTSIQFRAGKCSLPTHKLENGKFLVTPEPRSGKVVLSKEQDGLMHFKWVNSVNNLVEDDRIVFPGEYTFKKVKTGVENDRVYMLKYNTGSQRLMFWMQDKDSGHDEEILKKVNDFLTNPNPVLTSNTNPPSSHSGALGPGEWMRMLGVAPPAGANHQRRPAATSAQPLPLGNLDLSSIISALSNPNPAGTARTGTSNPVDSAESQVLETTHQEGQQGSNASQNNNQTSADQNNENNDSGGDNSQHDSSNNEAQ